MDPHFKSQALLDDAALLTGKSYVDLNPMRATIADTPEASDYASIQARIRAMSPTANADPHDPPRDTAALVKDRDSTSASPALLPLRGPQRQHSLDHIPFAFSDHLPVVDRAGRAVRDDKRGAIAAHATAILVRLGIQPEAYLDRLGSRHRPFVRAMGRAERLRQAANALGQQLLKGVREANALFPVGAG